MRHLKVVMHERGVSIVDIESGEKIANVEEVQTDLRIELATGLRISTAKITLTDIPIEYENRTVDGSVAPVIEDAARLIRQKVSE